MNITLLSDRDAELYRGGYAPIIINTNNNIRVESTSPRIGINTRIVTANQLNNSASVSAFGGVNSSYQAELITQQINELYLA